MVPLPPICLLPLLSDFLSLRATSLILMVSVVAYITKISFTFLLQFFLHPFSLKHISFGIGNDNLLLKNLVLSFTIKKLLTVPPHPYF